MMDVATLLDIPPYSLDKKAKAQLLDPFLSGLTRFHYHHNTEYQKMLNADCFDPEKNDSYTTIPFLPVRLFKLLDLYSVPKEDIIKTMTSSGTTGQSVSRIFLDRETSANQTKALTKIVSSFIGRQRLPMLIIDSESTVSNRQFFSARTAGILGFSLFGNKKDYALQDTMELDIEKVFGFFEKHKGERVLLFGFTFMVWQYFYKALVKNGLKLDFSDSILIHGGGWKKLQNESVSPGLFKQRLRDVCGIREVYDYYGMVEQTGSVYMECEQGHLHAPVFADIITRRATDFSMAEINEKGLLQVLSVLPKSYPGHSLLTEDEGIILGEDDCPCGRLGKYFTVTGRVKNAELRGCSDVYAEKL
jgi:phenylacetate-coenzyme A ligase PaaK-like adenylate-forming protein